jgi:hypothetical protein
MIHQPNSRVCWSAGQEGRIIGLPASRVFVSRVLYSTMVQRVFQEAFMSIKTSVIVVLVLAAIPLSVAGKKKTQPERAMLEKMEAVPCGARERGLSGVGSLWASAGITHVNSNEKLCPQYLLRTDEKEYEIRPTDGKHPVILPIGHEGEFKIKNNHMFLTVEDGDRKTRTYEVVSIKQINSDANREESSKISADKP